MKRKVLIVLLIILIVVAIIVGYAINKKISESKQPEKTSLEIKREKVLNYFEDSLKIQVFFKKDTTEETIEALKDRISKIQGVSSVTLKTKEEGLEELKNYYEEKGQVVDGYSADMFPDSLLIKLSDKSRNEEVKTEIKAIDENNFKAIEDISDEYKTAKNYFNMIFYYTEEQLDELIELEKIE